MEKDRAMKNRLLLPLILILSIGLSGMGQDAAAQDAALARLRVVHAVSGAPEVDIYIDNTLVSGGLAFGEATPHFAVTAGANQVDIRPQGAAPDAAPLVSQTVNTLADLAFSLVLQGSPAAPEGVVYEDVLDPLDFGLSRLTAIHTVSGAAAVDILRTDGAPLMVGVSYGVPYGTINIPAGSYEVVAAPSGGTPEAALTDPTPLDLRTNVLYTLLILTGSDKAQAVVLASPVNPAPDTVLVRLAHAAPDAPAVDVYLDDTLIVSNLQVGQVSSHVGLPSGEHDFSLRETGSPPNSDALFSDKVELQASAQTLAIFSTEDDELTFGQLEDDIADLAPNQARLQVLNLSGAAVNLEISDGEPLAEELESGSAGEAVDLAPGEVTLSGDAELDGLLYGGTLYSVLAFPAGNFVLAATPINVQLSSAPTGGSAEVAAAPPAATEEVQPTQEAQAPTPTLPVPSPVVTVETAAVEPTLAPPQPTQAPPQAAVATLAPTVPPPAAQPNARPTKPGIYPPVEIIFGVVNLNQGVNLQCREYPSTAARSLGLIPNGTELVIVGLFAPRDTTGDIGRTDAILIDGIPDFTPLLDEEFQIANFDAAFLGQFEPENLWLNIDWRLEDGTPFGCWVNAQYVQIDYRNKRIDDIVEYLELVKGKNLELTPYNVPGGPRDPDTFVSPQQVSAPTPLPGAQILATVNVNRGVNLQLRRTPGVDGESLALVPGGTQLTVLAKTTIPPTGNIGEPTIPEWLFVELLQADGTRLRGWISGEYVILTLGGRLITLDDVPLAETVERGGPVTDEGIIQPSGANALPTPLPVTPQFVGIMLTDPGISLNLRDQPNETALVRASVPSGSQLTVLGRNGAGTWLNVVVKSPTGDIAGWVAAQFIRVTTAQGVPVEIGQVPIVSGEPDTFNPNAPAATPTPASTG